MNDFDLVPIAEACGLFPKRGGKPLGVKAIRKRIRTGQKGVRLEARMDGGEWFTCRAWVEQYLEDVTKAYLGPLPGKVRSNAKEVARAKAILSRRWGKEIK